MIRLKLWILASVLVVLMVTAGAIHAGLFSENQYGTDRDKSLSALENLRQQYASINSIHIVANAKIVVYGQKFAVGDGSFEYWAEGTRYRVKCRTDKQLKLSSDVDIAYNGERFQFLDLASGILSYRSTDDFRSYAALPNPLFLPVDFMSHSDDECRLCSLRLSDMKFNNERWNSRARALRVMARDYDTKDGMITDLEMPGGTFKKTPFKLRVRMQGSDEERSLPSQIERIDSAGRVRASISFKSIVENDSLRLPREMLIKVFDEKGNLTFRLEYLVTLLEINQPLDKKTFTIDFDDAEGVWDSDAKKFIKEKRP